MSSGSKLRRRRKAKERRREEEEEEEEEEQQQQQQQQQQCMFVTHHQGHIAQGERRLHRVEPSFSNTCKTIQCFICWNHRLVQFM
jgi:hypothetical protein